MPEAIILILHKFCPVSAFRKTDIFMTHCPAQNRYALLLEMLHIRSECPVAAK
jgi:hypothetical protein